MSSRRAVGPAQAVTVRAPAKINVYLSVGTPRADGFHPLATVYQAIGLYDDVTARPGGSGTVPVRVKLAAADHVDADAVPLAPGTNLVHRAAELLGAHHGRRLRSDISISKAIPVAGGLAGGSADAAAALVALDRLHDLQTTDEALLAIAAELGSDVPFSLVGGTAQGVGRGEQVTAYVDPAIVEAAWWWVVVPSATGLATPQVYAHFDRMRPDAHEAPVVPDRVLAALASQDPTSLAAVLHNDLQAVALDLRPDLVDVLADGEEAGALRGIVSGSGPTCVFLCEDADHAREVAGRLQEQHPVVLVATGPVAGAHRVEYV
ncbi:4-(cytidine 5'-diphospho)-2-C-methyl-D-erythritol kinase [Nocardioides zeae]|uniref:4-diphosphocytidyl-2-C-methyl-D-erythritol kinase n=1 Tax=Nocardioides imazamoxiresistens TaxID=3231893 RepID=A0ABU3PWV9_9ACTN|nr:4-(cytidine 5'-diphospho)-2-C-methyl-D-erythritol kinase [Nocardioides zeae]MDT9593639.1 4-(cytidine 5'-diphospho)-2-C-methyl-D-erythritol kinase [Nocardioides zeae]